MPLGFSSVTHQGLGVSSTQSQKQITAVTCASYVCIFLRFKLYTCLYINAGNCEISQSVLTGMTLNCCHSWKVYISIPSISDWKRKAFGQSATSQATPRTHPFFQKTIFTVSNCQWNCNWALIHPLIGAPLPLRPTLHSILKMACTAVWVHKKRNANQVAARSCCFV